MKILRFSEPLPEMILTGKKNSTFRINDEKEIKIGDNLSLCYNNDEEFAKAVVTETKETIFSRLTNKDFEGHEKFSSNKEMYDLYSKYYKTKIGLETKVKIIRFKLI
jgi:hypothetical protein